MATQYVDCKSGENAAASYTGSHAGIGVDSATGFAYFNPDGTRRRVEYGGVTTLSAVSTLTAAQTGRTLVLSSGTEFVTTLPAPAVDLKYRFVVGAAPSGASYTVVTNGSANIIKGCIASSADAGGSSASTGATPVDTITFVDGQAAAGDWVEVVSDGTSWFVSGCCGDEDGITLTVAS